MYQGVCIYLQKNAGYEASLEVLVRKIERIQCWIVVNIGVLFSH